MASQVHIWGASNDDQKRAFAVLPGGDHHGPIWRHLFGWYVARDREGFDWMTESEGGAVRRCRSIRGHKFEPRYDCEPASSFKMGEGNMSGWAFEKLVEAMMRRTYVYDICVRCGTKVKRDAAA